MIEPAPLFLHRVVDCSRWKQMSLSGTEVATRTGMNDPSWETHDTHGWRPHGQEQAHGAGPAVPVGSQLTDEYLWQVRLDDGSWQDVLESWNVALTAAVRDGLPHLCLVRPWNARGSKVVHEQYYIDCRHPRWITQESVRTGRRRALRMVQVVRPIGTYVWPPPPPPYPPPALASVAAGLAAQAIIL